MRQTTDSWDFACDAAEFPEDSTGPSLVVVDDYNYGIGADTRPPGSTSHTPR
jgi:hypothetical protein